MKIYHTETQEDYDALMVELEADGSTWYGEGKPTSWNGWSINSNETCVIIGGPRINQACLRSCKNYYPKIPIIKYKAKADEKMKFNKQNIERAFDKFMQGGNDSFADLKERIINLVDEPEKVVVPKCFDEWYKEIEVEHSIPDSAKQFALWKLCQQGFGCGFEDFRGNKIPYETDLGEWLFENKFLAIDAVLNGYTIEPEQLYYIPLPDLEMLDGTQQVLSKSKNGNRYFASRPDKNLKQRYTKTELEQVPEIYKPYAKPIEEEKE